MSHECIVKRVVKKLNQHKKRKKMFEILERPVLSDFDFEKLNKDEFKVKWKQLNDYVDSLEERNMNNLHELAKLKNILLINFVSSKEYESTVKQNLLIKLKLKNKYINKVGLFYLESI